MAILTIQQLRTIRKAFRKRIKPGPMGDYSSDQIDVAAQAIEDWWVDQLAAIANTIDSTGIVLTNLEKRKLARGWIDMKFGGDE